MGVAFLIFFGQFNLTVEAVLLLLHKGWRNTERHNMQYQMKKTNKSGVSSLHQEEYELVIANVEKVRLTAELKIANVEKEIRAAKLVIAEAELASQNAVKAIYAAELVIANGEKAIRAAELVIANIKKFN